LASLDRRGGTGITAVGVLGLAPHRQLAALGMRECEQLTDAGLCLTSVDWLAQLASPDLHCCHTPTEVGLAHLCQALRHITDRNPEDCHTPTEMGLAHLCQPLPRPTALGPGGAAITDAGLAHVAGLKRLASLGPHFCELTTGAGLAHLGKLEHLTFLDLGELGECHGVCRREPVLVGQAPAPRLPGPARLPRGHTGVARLVKLAELTLASLSLSCCGPIMGRRRVAPSQTPAARRPQPAPYPSRGLPRQPTWNHGHKPEALGRAPAPALTSLSLRACGEITDTGSAHLGRLEGLADLSLAECNLITGAGLAHVARLRRLALDLRPLPLDDGCGLGGCVCKHLPLFWRHRGYFIPREGVQ